MRTKLQTEVDRLRHLRSINDHVREEEVDLAEECLKELEKARDKVGASFYWFCVFLPIL